MFLFFFFCILLSPSSFFNQNLIYNVPLYLYLLCFQFTYDFIKERIEREGKKKKKVQKNERHVSRKRGARESVHPSAPWTLFTSPMLIPRVFSDIDPNFTISMRFTNFSFSSFFFFSILYFLVPGEPLVERVVFGGTAARSHLSSWSFVDRS